MKPPYDLEAEEAFVGALLLSPSQLDAMAQRVQPEDLYVVECSALYAAMLMLRDQGSAIDVITLKSIMGDRAPDRQRVQALQAAAPISLHVSDYAEVIIEHAARRRLLQAAERIRAAAIDKDVSGNTALALAHDVLRWADAPVGPAEPSPDVDAVAGLELEHDWIVKGLLERLDRVLVVAGEGHGKSLLLAQMAVQLAAGIHPWLLHSVDPVRTMMLDLENPPRIIARRMRLLRDAADRHHEGRGWDYSMCRIEARPQGLDVTQRADERWLMSKIAANRPDVLMVGPLYKLHEVEEEKSQAVRQVQKVLDNIRARYRVAVIMETHAPHESFAKDGRLRPAGSRLWIRWPEWVLALTPQSKEKLDGTWRLEHVRPGREQRTWPARLRRGQHWPWVRDEL